MARLVKLAVAVNPLFHLLVQLAPPHTEAEDVARRHRYGPYSDPFRCVCENL